VLIYRFTLWRNLVLLQIKLMGLLVGQLFVTDRWVIIATAELPLSYGLLWILTKDHFAALTRIYVGLVLFRLAQRVFFFRDIAKPDPALTDPPLTHPRLAGLLQAVQLEAGAPPFKSVSFPLSPLKWHEFGCSADEYRKNKQCAVIPIGCLGIYSIFDLKCELAHHRIRRKSRFLVPACEINYQDLQRFAGPSSGFRDRPRWQTWAVSGIGAAYRQYLGQWNCTSI
jgi:hypothetical protein